EPSGARVRNGLSFEAHRDVVWALGVDEDEVGGSGDRAGPVFLAEIEAAGQAVRRQVGFDRDIADLRAGRAGDGVACAFAELRLGAGFETVCGRGVERQAFGQGDVGVGDVGGVDFA